MIIAIITAILMLTGCQREGARCAEVCTTLAHVCATAAQASPFGSPEETVES